MRPLSVLIASALLLGCASVASAQTENRWGLVMAVPTSAGLQWQANELLTLRVDGAFDRGASEQLSTSLSVVINGVPISSGTRTTSFRHSTLSLGASGLVTVARREQLRLYVVPRAAWRRTHTTFTSTEEETVRGVTTVGPEFSDSTTTNGLELEGLFGANYRLSDRFSVFGETGVGFTSPTSTSSSSSDELTSYVVGSRGYFGVVVHF